MNSLPIDVRIRLIDKLLKSLNPISKEIDELWAVEAERRVLINRFHHGIIYQILDDEIYQKSF